MGRFFACDSGVGSWLCRVGCRDGGLIRLPNHDWFGGLGSYNGAMLKGHETTPCKQASKFMSTQAVYVAPLKALARERLKDWREKFGKKMGLGVLELTGDNTPDMNALRWRIRINFMSSIVVHQKRVFFSGQELKNRIATPQTSGVGRVSHVRRFVSESVK